MVKCVHCGKKLMSVATSKGTAYYCSDCRRGSAVDGWKGRNGGYSMPQKGHIAGVVVGGGGYGEATTVIDGVGWSGKEYSLLQRLIRVEEKLDKLLREGGE